MYKLSRLPDRRLSRLPPGRYMLNNGPKQKGEHGSWSMGDNQEEVKALLRSQFSNEISFTRTPQQADYVILPAGVSRPGEKVVRLNPALANPAVIFRENEIYSMLPSISYSGYARNDVQPSHGYGSHHAPANSRKSHGRKQRSKAYNERRRKSTRRKSATAYTHTDPKTGEQISITVPEQLEPSGKSRFLNPNYFNRIEEIKTIQISPSDYTVQRSQLRPDSSPPVPSVKPKPLPQPTPEETRAWNPPPAAHRAEMESLLQNGKDMLSLISTGGGPLPMEQHDSNVIDEIKAQTQLGQTPQTSRADTVEQPPTEIRSPEDTLPNPQQIKPMIKTSFKQFFQELNLAKEGSEAFSTLDDWKLAAQGGTGPDKSQEFLGFSSQLYTLYRTIWQPVIFQIRTGFEIKFQATDDTGSLGQWVAQQEKTYQNQVNMDWNQALETLIPTVEDVEVFLNTRYDLETAQDIMRSLVKTAELLRKMIIDLESFNQQYRKILRTALNRDVLGTRCNALSSLCIDYVNPENAEQKQIGGEPMSYLLSALFNISCSMFDAEKQFLNKNQIEFQRLCDHMDGVSASATDIHNYLFYQGVMDQDAKFSVTSLGPNFCKNMYDVTNHARVVMSEIDQEELSQGMRGAVDEEDALLSETLMRWNLREFMFYLQNLDHVSTSEDEKQNGAFLRGHVYTEFVHFILGRYNEEPMENTTPRSDIFPQLKVAVMQLPSSINRRKAWLAMYFVAVVMVMANLCQEYTGFTYARIEEFLTVKKTPDHDLKWKVGEQTLGFMRQFLSKFGFFKR